MTGAGAGGRDPLPIDPHVAELARLALAEQRLVVRAPPGSGKTTRLPAALLEAGVVGQVVVLEPRRLAARAAARRVAAERGGEVGDEVGYQVRHDRRVGRATRLVFATEGVLARRLVQDPFLDGVGAVVLDEFHERHLEADLVLAMLREVRETVRPDLTLVVMSATLDMTPLRDYLGACPVRDVDAPAHPVEIVWQDRVERGPLPERVAAGVRRALRETDGHVLAFLPGVGEIRAVAARLDGLGAATVVLPLHGSLDAAAQDRALAPGPERKVVLATNIAESSLTVAGVTAVVDAGLARVPRHDPRVGLDALQIERISLASATQRGGRAGRTGPGRCYRLWTLAEERGMAERQLPEVRRLDLAGPLLQVRAFTGGAPDRFAWFEAPDPAALARADALLDALGALDERGAPGPIGKRMLGLPLHPRLARMQIEAERRRCPREGALLAALLAERDIVRRGADDAGDLLARAELVDELERQGFAGSACRAVGVEPGAVRAVARARDQIARRAAAGTPTRADLARVVLAGFADRVACRSVGDRRAAVMVGGRGLSLSETAAAALPELFVAVAASETARRAQSRARVELAVGIERAWLADLHPEAIHERVDAELNAERGRVRGVRRVCYRDLVLEEHGGVEPPAAIAAALLAELLARDPWRHLRGAGPLRSFLARVRWLAERGFEVPAFTDADVARAAAALCAGRRDLAALRAADVRAMLAQELPADVRRRLASLVPENVTLPSGRRVPVDYSGPAGPKIAARLQEFFGLTATPTIAGGAVPLVVELLAPNRRPVQVTRDLASFWAEVYPRVRSELRRRYPKHAWPEDPRTAPPQRL